MQQTKQTRAHTHTSTRTYWPHLASVQSERRMLCAWLHNPPSLNGSRPEFTVLCKIVVQEALAWCVNSAEATFHAAWPMASNEMHFVIKRREMQKCLPVFFCFFLNLAAAFFHISSESRCYGVQEFQHK